LLLEELKTELELLELEPAGGGCFEVALDGELIHSKLATGSFPDDRAILKMIRTRG
jgi:selenoprotein W-related protein